jgi:heterodisulfide reductase subunit C
MHFISQIIFTAVIGITVYLFVRKAGEIRRNILLGRPEQLNDHPSLRRKNLLLLAFGQKKMFRNPLVAVMHFVIYTGFIIINIEVLEIVLDGISGTHRLFAGPLGKVYPWLINAFECLAAGVLLMCLVFLIRRNLIKLKRFASKDLNGWPRSDANYILITEIILMSLFLTMNASDTLLLTREMTLGTAGNPLNFIISRHIHPILNGLGDRPLMIMERTCWWLHIAGIFAFLNYLPYSKHLHILLAFPNAYYARLGPKGKMSNMPEIQKEVVYAMEPETIPATNDENLLGTAKKFGARDIFDLSWKNLLDAYSCTECGRCTAACPANITGKLLSPRKIMMDTRDRLEEVGKTIRTNTPFTKDNKSLLGNYISEEEIRACTTCNACVEECPVSISPLDIILQLRRYLVMEESKTPQEWNSMFSNTENNFAPWKFSPDERDRWVTEIEKA